MSRLRFLASVFSVGIGLQTNLFTQQGRANDLWQQTTQQTSDKEVSTREPGVDEEKIRSVYDEITNPERLPLTDERIQRIREDLYNIYRDATEKEEVVRVLHEIYFNGPLTPRLTKKGLFLGPEPDCGFVYGRQTGEKITLIPCEPLCNYQREEVRRLREGLVDLVSIVFTDTPSNSVEGSETYLTAALTYAVVFGMDALQEDIEQSRLFEGWPLQWKEKVLEGTKRKIRIKRLERYIEYTSGRVPKEYTERLLGKRDALLENQKELIAELEGDL